MLLDITMFGDWLKSQNYCLIIFYLFEHYIIFLDVSFILNPKFIARF